MLITKFQPYLKIIFPVRRWAHEKRSTNNQDFFSEYEMLCKGFLFATGSELSSNLITSSKSEKKMWGNENLTFPTSVWLKISLVFENVFNWVFFQWRVSYLTRNCNGSLNSESLKKKLVKTVVSFTSVYVKLV